MIRKHGGKYCVHSRKSGRNLGCSRTKAGARQREREVQYFKHNKRREVHVSRHVRRRNASPELVRQISLPVAITEEEAIPVVLELRERLPGADITIVGGVERNGFSFNDLDLQIIETNVREKDEHLYRVLRDMGWVEHGMAGPYPYLSGHRDVWTMPTAHAAVTVDIFHVPPGTTWHRGIP